MRIGFELVAWVDDELRSFDEAALEADPALLGREPVEGRYRIADEGQPELVVLDDLFVLAQHLSFTSVIALLDDVHGRYDYRYMTQGHWLSLVRDGDVITLEGDAVPRVRLDAPTYLPRIFACGERFSTAYARAPAADAARLAFLKPFAARAHQALRDHGIDVDAIPRPDPVPPAAPDVARWNGLWAVTLEPARAESFYRDVLGDAVDAVRFVKMTSALAPPQWVSFVTCRDRPALNERLLDSGAGCIATLDDHEIWVDAWGAVFGVAAGAERGAAALHALCSPDVEGAARAAADAFGWMVERDGASCALRDGDRVVAAVRGADAGQPASWDTAIAVGDVEHAVARAMAGGAIVEQREPAAVWLRDPFGARFGVAHR
jgi:hypothetical protein